MKTQGLIYCLFLAVGCAHPGQQTFHGNSSGLVSKKSNLSETEKMIAEVDSEISTKEKKPILFGNSDSFVEEDLNNQSGKTSRDINENQRLVEDDVAKIPIELNEKVQWWIEYFTVRDRERFQRFLDRGERFRSMISGVLEEKGIPQDLYYLALIESGFQTHATSHASAVGVWQFIKATGQRYGLKVDPYVDERMDPIRATNAAALYLTDLHNVFQNWYLAMAAYNAGEFRIMQTIMKAKTRDFWELVEKKALPKETMNYVPKFIAATIIGHNPKKFGFTINRGLNELPELVPISVPSPVRLTTLASKLGIGLSELKSHNPHIRRDLTSVSNRMYEVWVPKEMVPNNLQSRLASLKPIKLNNVAQANGTEAYQVHTVRRGESLGRIANRYRISVAQLKRLNGLKSNTIHAGKSLKVRSSELTRYEVRKGDNLHKIAKKFGLTVNELRKLNRIQAGRSRLYIGQVLKVGNTEG